MELAQDRDISTLQTNTKTGRGKSQKGREVLTEYLEVWSPMRPVHAVLQESLVTHFQWLQTRWPISCLHKYHGCSWNGFGNERAHRHSPTSTNPLTFSYLHKPTDIFLPPQTHCKQLFQTRKQPLPPSLRTQFSISLHVNWRSPPRCLYTPATHISMTGHRHQGASTLCHTRWGSGFDTHVTGKYGILEEGLYYIWVHASSVASDCHLQTPFQPVHNTQSWKHTKMHFSADIAANKGKDNSLAQVLQPATRIPPQPSHTETPTHIETRTHNVVIQ